MSPTMFSRASQSTNGSQLGVFPSGHQVYERPYFASAESSSSSTSISSNSSFGSFTIDNMAPPKTVLFSYHLGHPETWSKFNINRDNPGDLYFSKLPVPGIYSIMPNKKRYLVALKPNGKLDKECIFRSYLDLESESYTTSSHSSESISSYSKSTTSSNSSSRTDISTSSNTSRSTVSSVLSTRSVTFADNKATIREQQPTKYQKLDYHHQKTTSKISLLNHSKPAKLQKCDINGYKPLRKPLRIKFCKILGRWMFKSEIEERMLNTIVCLSTSCMHEDPRACGKGSWKDFFALDDAFSWVMVGEEKKNRKSTKVEGEDRIDLYCVDEETNCMRRQDKIEAESSRKLLELAKGGNPRNVFFDDRADYMAVLRYLGMGCQEK